MDFSLTPDQQNIRDAILRHCSQFPDEYWLERDREGVFPHEFYKSMVEAGWLGIAMPDELGGSGLGITEAAVMMQAIAESGAAMSGASSIHLPVFGLQPVVVFERRDGGYVVNGETIWISTAQVAGKMLLLARTTPLDEVKRKTEGLSLFYTSLDRSKIEVRLIHKMGRHAVDSNMLFIQDLWIPEEDRIGKEGSSWLRRSSGCQSPTD